MIRINDRFYIGAETYGYNVKIRRVSDKDGKEVFSTGGYFSTLEKCFSWMIQETQRQFVAEDKAVELRQAMREMRRINKEYEQLFKDNIGELENLQYDGTDEEDSENEDDDYDV